MRGSGSLWTRCRRPGLSWRRELSVPRVTCATAHEAQRVKAIARAARPTPIALITVSKRGSSAAADAMAGEWAGKLQRHVKFEEVHIKANPRNSSLPEIAVEAEGASILKALRPKDRLIVLDERGREVSSLDMAKAIAEAGDSGASRLVFCIGGPHGHADAVRKCAADVMRLSAMVLNHQVARIVLLEQVYRGWSLLKGEPYHH